jgi:hypothetical protein
MLRRNNYLVIVSFFILMNKNGNALNVIRIVYRDALVKAQANVDKYMLNL